MPSADNELERNMLRYLSFLTLRHKALGTAFAGSGGNRRRRQFTALAPGSQPCFVDGDPLILRLFPCSLSSPIMPGPCVKSVKRAAKER